MSPFYYVKNNYDSACSLSVQFYLIVVGSVVAFVLLVLIAYIKIKRDKKKRLNMILSHKSDSDQRLMQNNKDPFYYGY
jgi:uncharacterized membrane protein